MKSIFRTIVFVGVLLIAVSCNIDWMYISIPNSNWCIEQEEQRAFAHFGKDRACILQRSNANGAVQFINGPYTTDGHAVDIVSDEGSSNRLIRTFSHLKNSKNKNFSTFKPQDYDNVNNSVWTSLKKDNFRLLYFSADGKMKQAEYRNVRHEEGVPYGWSLAEGTYTHAANHVGFGDESGTLFPEVMLVDDVWFMHFPVQEDNGTSALKGTLWTYETSSYPGLILFDTNSGFTRILLASRILYQVSRGTYSQSGNVVTMTLDGKTEECQIVNDRFTFMERPFALFE